jgi:putative flippase GtrA
MDLSPSGLLAYARTDEGRKKLRYAGVSVVFVPLGQILIQVFGVWMNFTTASLVSAAILTLPNFFANKRFVWRVTSSENLRSQVLVFWVAAMLGVTLATLLTKVVEGAMADRSPLVLRASVFVAQLVGFGIVWVGRFLILDRWLFKLAGDDPEHADEVIGEIPT